jgi:hypothetical protein
MTEATQLDIQQQKQELELEYVTGTCLLETEVNDKYKSERKDITYIRKLQAVASMYVKIKLSKFSFRRPVHKTTIDITDRLLPNGTYTDTDAATKRIEQYSLTPKPDDASKYQYGLAKDITDRLKLTFPSYSTDTEIKISSRELMHSIEPRHQTVLVKPYLNQIIDRAIKDAKEIVGEPT